jgi:hypothetical protein
MARVTPHRATRDVDLLGFGDAAHHALLSTFSRGLNQRIAEDVRRYGDFAMSCQREISKEFGLQGCVVAVDENPPATTALPL